MSIENLWGATTQVGVLVTTLKIQRRGAKILQRGVKCPPFAPLPNEALYEKGEKPQASWQLRTESS